jgi:hypothetical protein
MKGRAIAVVGIMALVTLGLGGPRASATSTGMFRLEWEAAQRGGRTVVSGYVHNDHEMRAENVRLLVEGLDASSKPVTKKTAYVTGTIPNRDRAYFEATMPAAASYRVTIESFDRAGCGNG